MCFFENSIHKLKPGGYYIIEDIQQIQKYLFQTAIEGWKNEYPHLTFEIVDIPSSKNNIDNVLLVIHYRTNDSPIQIINEKYNTEFTNKLAQNEYLFGEIFRVCGCKFHKGMGSYLIDGNTYEYCESMYEKQELLYNCAKNVNTVLEIGTYIGHSLLIMLLANPNLKITCVDYDATFVPKVVDFLNKCFNNNITFIHSDSFNAFKMINTKFDLFHIDGTHENDVITEEYNICKNYSSYDDMIKVIFDDQEHMKHLQSVIDDEGNVIKKVIPNCAFENVYYEIKI